MSTLVLIHSPLVGPMTWEAVASELEIMGPKVIVVSLPDSRRLKPPYGPAFATAVADSMSHLPASESVILVGHSNSGLRLATYGQAATRKVDGYILVDSGIPGQSADPEALAIARRQATKGQVPSWSDEVLRFEIASDLLRATFGAQLPSAWPLALFEEEIQKVKGWPDAPCGYLELTDQYPDSVDYAYDQDWALAEAPGTHFEMLNSPATVAEALLDLLDQMEIDWEQ
ncbi:MAG TPA: hypothetical protein VG015_02430 [Candidatus Dormibacteraeota bacterium]|jgi:pimeloyl-ACP methyl ester carboxylesterase|nr:hypothetical protein [Candidatus Dormibacteraeota bacterium]